MKHTNPQVEQMTSFIVMDVLERANELQKQGVDIIHLEVGEPDFDVPSCVSEAAKAAYDRHLTHYTHSLGDPELRREIAATLSIFFPWLARNLSFFHKVKAQFRSEQ